jgi:hypothetical protein
MSKWIDKDLFKRFAEEKTKEAEQEQKQQGGTRRLEMLFPTPQRGTTEKPKVYEGRFLPDPKGEFYLKIFYNMFMSGEQWQFFRCPKTDGLENWCPWCSVTQKLFMGGKEDKAQAQNYKRKEKYVGNWFVVLDPRDVEREEENRIENTVKLYEFPSRVESKLKQEITDTKEGYGFNIFNPGEDGYNFILKVKSTKKDKEGRQWPDYSDSMFSRTPQALGTDRQIKKILDTCYDLKEYVDSLERSDDDVLGVLKSEMVWELVIDEWKRMKGLKEAAKETEEEKELDLPTDTDDTDTDTDTEETQKEEVSAKEDNIPEEESDEALLAELADL